MIPKNTQKIIVPEYYIHALGDIPEKIKQSFRRVPRVIFVDPPYQAYAYQDQALPIEYDQTISQPSLVARMIDLLALTGNENILEIGTGSGFQSAILSHLAKTIYSIEIVPELFKQAKKRLSMLNITNVHCLLGDGSIGYSDHAPYDAIIVSAASPGIPYALTQQLKQSGKIIIPVGDTRLQRLMIVKKISTALDITEDLQVHFVPLIGKQGWDTNLFSADT